MSHYEHGQWNSGGTCNKTKPTANQSSEVTWTPSEMRRLQLEASREDAPDYDVGDVYLPMKIPVPPQGGKDGCICPSGPYSCKQKDTNLVFAGSSVVDDFLHHWPYKFLNSECSHVFQYGVHMCHCDLVQIYLLNLHHFQYITDFIPFDIVGTFSSQSALSFEIVTLLSSKGLTGFPNSMAFATCTLRLCQVNERSLFTLRDEEGFDPEDEDKAKTAILSKLVDVILMRIGDSFEDLVDKLQEHWDDLEGCAVGFSEACKIDALCECFDDRVFTEIVTAVRRTDQVLMSMLCQRELRQGLKKLLQMAMVEGSAQIEQQETVTDEVTRAESSCTLTLNSGCEKHLIEDEQAFSKLKRSLAGRVRV
ncbi:hypothetical protein SELMODRAFT_417221 [Selaginella moellendorffii]|uniref:Uncharacterized protein n=1 Tax=Selaginella moellendorffii TaxID=88036 RepID=D8S1S1_SELML|nr:hypothetical protein SELMODRAFT_417221 [Selaginella moellendorffii]